MPKRITPEEYKKYFEEHYPNYELLSDYLGSTEYIHVRCKIDGYEWDTKPIWLKHGAGCKKCYYRRSSEKRRKAEELFIKQAKERHGNKYDYSKVKYLGNKIPVTLICPKHGEFDVRPDKHLSRGDGCPECAKIENGLKRRTPQDIFFARCAEVHNGKYDYSNSVYNGQDKPITVICPIHGEFTQNAESHLEGHGCPVCSESLLEKKMKGALSKHNIVFEWQKRFKWLGRLSLDFYLPDYNIAIECQGLQHYSDFYFNWSKGSALEDIIRRDELKSSLCKENGINLIYFARENAIFNASSIYTKENTFTSFDSLLSYITNSNDGKLEKTLLNKDDLKEIVASAIRKIICY